MSTQNNPTSPPATPDRLRGLAEQGYFDAKTLERALQIAGQIPAGPAWRNFLEVALLILGAAFTVSGIFFFFAYNWAGMHRFTKFGLIEAGILITVALAFYLGLERLPGKVALGVAALLTGALLAVYGQAYQTGADAYTLFLNWALLIAGWVLISAYSPLWLGWLVLFNITIIAYWGQVFGDLSPAMFAALTAVNGLSLLAVELAQQRGIAWLQSRWLPRVGALMTLLALVIPTLIFIFSIDEGDEGGLWFYLMPIAYLVFVGLTVYFYTRSIHDLFMLTLVAFSLIVVITALVAKLFDFDFDNAGPYLLLGGLIIGQAALAVGWLRRVARQWEVSHV